MTATRAISQTPFRGTSARKTSACSRREASVATAASPRQCTSSESARGALDVAARGGVVCASAIGLAERVAPPDVRAQRIDLALGEDTPVEFLVELLVEAGYEHVERVEQRGELAVRGGLVDVYPSTGGEPVPDRPAWR